MVTQCVKLYSQKAGCPGRSGIRGCAMCGHGEVSVGHHPDPQHSCVEGQVDVLKRGSGDIGKVSHVKCVFSHEGNPVSS